MVRCRTHHWWYVCIDSFMMIIANFNSRIHVIRSYLLWCRQNGERSRHCKVEMVSPLFSLKSAVCLFIMYITGSWSFSDAPPSLWALSASFSLLTTPNQKHYAWTQSKKSWLKSVHETTRLCVQRLSRNIRSQKPYVRYAFGLLVLLVSLSISKTVLSPSTMLKSYKTLDSM